MPTAVRELRPDAPADEFLDLASQHPSRGRVGESDAPVRIQVEEAVVDLVDGATKVHHERAPANVHCAPVDHTESSLPPESGWTTPWAASEARRTRVNRSSRSSRTESDTLVTMWTVPTGGGSRPRSRDSYSLDYDTRSAAAPWARQGGIALPVVLPVLYSRDCLFLASWAPGAPSGSASACNLRRLTRAIPW